ncbi:MAG: efflux RND transporter periplasmic adaptor subunit [Candidatus Xenobia bacterium]
MALFLLLLTGGGFLIYRALHTTPLQKGGRGAGAAQHALPVKVAKVTTKDEPVNLQVVGNMLSYTTVPVSSQVSGQLMKVFFKQGDFVQAGQPLFAIDPRPFQASLAQSQANQSRDTALLAQSRTGYAQWQATLDKDRAAIKQAQANLDRDVAQQKFAQSEESRYRGLLNEGFVTAEQYEQQKANAGAYDGTIMADRAAIATAVATLKADQETTQGILSSIQANQASVKADQAAVEGAGVQLAYTYIKAPISGRTGSYTLYPGAIVGANGSTPMVTIDQITPIYATFAAPEHYLDQIRSVPLGSLQVEIDMADGGPPEKGRIIFVDQSVDPTTGTIPLRAEFANPRHRLWPGQYVMVKVLLKELKNALVVPSQAVNPGQHGDYVFVVKPDNTVESRTVQVVQSDTHIAVIKSGLRPGETVVTDGQLQLTDGAKVEISTGDYIPTKGIKTSPGANSSGSPTAAPSGSRHHRHPQGS